MAVPFAKTMRSLKEDRPWLSLLALTVVFLLLGAWATWLVRGKVSVYAVTTTSRLEAKGSAYPIKRCGPDGSRRIILCWESGKGRRCSA